VELTWNVAPENCEKEGPRPDRRLFSNADPYHCLISAERARFLVLLRQHKETSIEDRMRSAIPILDCDTGIGSVGDVRMDPHREREQRF
jgi:hypothetical protein